MSIAPRTSDSAIADLSFAHLQWVVSIDSQSDELSEAIPTTEGQRTLAAALAGFYEELGATVEQDAFANVLAWFPGRGALAAGRPVALAVHLDTARGTQAVPRLHVVHAWDGSRIPFPKNEKIQVDGAHYPSLAAWVGQDIIHGEGDFPFGLDDKLGLTHCMTLAKLLAVHPEVSHPPLVLVARPDEEVGRHAAVVALAKLFAERGVSYGYTVDGILPFEVNVENFNAAGASVTFSEAWADGAPQGALWVAHVGGVNTHGATAAAEGHRAAPRLVAEWRARVAPEDAVFTGFASDALRDCDAVVHVRVRDGAAGRVAAALDAVMAPHVPRGATFEFAAAEPAAFEDDPNVEPMLAWLSAFYSSNPGFPLGCEDSAGRQGYSHPYRARSTASGLRLDIRIRDFDPSQLQVRREHVRALAEPRAFSTVDQYVNMGPRLAGRPELVDIARSAAADVGVPVLLAPIRGGTGVDPFLDEDIPIANLGTGYFAPESEKELTSRQLLVQHAKWLFALVQRLQ
jgi:tripeptide aminopeptidase